MSAHLLRSLLWALSCALVLASPAAADDELGISRDGASWSSELDGSLFDPAVRWVPGDRRVAKFYVRNRADGGGRLVVSATTDDPDQLLRHGDLRIHARVGAGRWVALDSRDGAFELDRRALGAGDTRRVRVRAAFRPTAGNDTQARHVHLSFAVSLAQIAAGPGDDGGGEGDLPQVGSSTSVWVLLGGACAVGAGAALMRKRTREEAGDGEAY